MLLSEKLYTFEEFWDFVNLPENAERRFELVNGVIIEMGASSKLNTITAGRAIHFLNAFVISRDLGVITVPDAGFKLGTRNYRQPDAAYVSKKNVGDMGETYFTIAPDLVIEVISPDEDIYTKALEYLEAGTKQVWAIFAFKKSVHIIRLNEDGGLYSQPLGIDDTLDGGDVLPGFTLPVRDLFPA